MIKQATTATQSHAESYAGTVTASLAPRIKQRPRQLAASSPDLQALSPAESLSEETILTFKIRSRPGLIGTENSYSIVFPPHSILVISRRFRLAENTIKFE